MFALGFITGIATLAILIWIDTQLEAYSGKRIATHLTTNQTSPWIYDPAEEDELFDEITRDMETDDQL